MSRTSFSFSSPIMSPSPPPRALVPYGRHSTGSRHEHAAEQWSGSKPPSKGKKSEGNCWQGKGKVEDVGRIWIGPSVVASVNEYFVKAEDAGNGVSELLILIASYGWGKEHPRGYGGNYVLQLRNE
ncbi:hypothetical protein PR202_ga14556 [Eleusine coracana subsp. coracana]|uniref:Uncharacterized protein n=1 Tax=Eleusine coracana subsp. coracana TaxID=191504 RepID=A0AAV5CHL5_ELECO|nr:hypothetical protein PR202_ga14556 [Eleusine coracana subsp. coracana]